jgi:hypothetical protein
VSDVLLCDTGEASRSSQARHQVKAIEINDIVLRTFVSEPAERLEDVFDSCNEMAGNGIRNWQCE